MSNPFDFDPGRSRSKPTPQMARDGGPYPDPRSAFLLTLATFVASGFIGIFFLGLGPIAASGVGQAIAFGAIATLVARRIPEPQADRIGLRSFDVRALPLVLCLLPAILLASELDNFAADAAGAPDVDPHSATHLERDLGDPAADPLDSAPTPTSPSSSSSSSSSMDETTAPEEPKTPEEEILEELRFDLDDPWVLAQAFVISVGITPIVEEFFFRGVVLQSLVTRLGVARGVGFVAMLYTLPHLPAVATAPRLLAGLFSAFGIGYLLGLIRLATGSILASILFASLTASVGLFSFAVRESLPLPGMNVEGSHLPITVTLASLLIVGWAAKAIYEEAVQRVSSASAPDADAAIRPDVPDSR